MMRRPAKTFNSRTSSRLNGRGVKRGDVRRHLRGDASSAGAGTVPEDSARPPPPPPPPPSSFFSLICLFLLAPPARLPDYSPEQASG